MLLILSPAKTLNESPVIPAAVVPTTPLFAKDAAALVAQLAKKSEKQIATLMGISPKLAALNAARFAHFETNPTQPCAWMFRGDVYRGLAIDTFPKKSLPALQQQVRILSGLYGLLRPFDAIHPYRLEMGTTLKTTHGKNLYQFWGSRLSTALNSAAKQADSNILLNLASQEYAAAIDWDALKLTPLTVHFKERKGNTLATIGLFAKLARGTMARWITTHQVQPKNLCDFSEDRYQFDRALSDKTNFVFVR